MKKTICLFTRKFGGDVVKSAYTDFQKALDEFNNAYHSNQKCGFSCIAQTTIDEDGNYTKVAKCQKGDEIIRLRLESVPLD
jgi:hypothetical protein